MTFYAVKKGRNVGIYNYWGDCRKNVIGFSGAIFKKFETMEEAEKFIKTKKKEYKASVDDPEALYIFTDGSCINNGKATSKAGIGICFYSIDIETNKLFTDISAKFSDLPTSNRAELTAVQTALEIINSKKIPKIINKLIIVTDSKYIIHVLTSKKIMDKNMDIISQVRKLINISKLKIFFHHVRSHTKEKDLFSIYNEKADMLSKLHVKSPT